ncbi:MAG: hypothetical protein E6J87_09365 [Deltaproteobacteria bacterium]|nr:MAG: hypothetical protein E6J87_09365 [Deltaproteobacteria bacterium]
MTRRRLWIALGALALIAVFSAVRRELGIELEPGSIRDAVGRLGVWGPLVFVGIVALRIPLGVPSALALIGGGLVFGSVDWAGREVIESRVPPRLRYLVDLAGSRVGAVFIALGTAYPLSPITSFPLVAGITSMAMPVFALAAATGSLGRAALYTYFGSRLVDADPAQLIGAGALIVAAVVAPLALPAPRAWLLQAFERRDRS